MPAEIERLYREHRARLVRLVERELHDRHDAEDVVQTAFLDAQRALERGTIPQNPRAWLAAIALNAAHRLWRRRLNAEPLEEYAVQETFRMPEFRVALASLPREQRTAVVYRDVLGLSYGETAEQMGTSVNAVTMLLHRGRERLRQTLGVTVGGLGLLRRWRKQAGMTQVTVVKGAAGVVAAAGLGTAGVVAARVVAPIGTDRTAGPAARSTRLPAAASRTPGRALALDPARRARDARAASDRSWTAEVVPSLLPSSLRVPTVSLPTLPIPTSPATPAATVTTSTPITAVSVSTLSGTTATVTTPITTVAVPIP